MSAVADGLLEEIGRRLGNTYQVNAPHEPVVKPLSSPPTNGEVYRVGVGTGPGPVNRGRPLPSGGLGDRPLITPDHNYSGPPQATGNYRAAPHGPANGGPRNISGQPRPAPSYTRSQPFTQYQPGYGPNNASTAPINPSPASPALTPRPLSGPVGSPPAFKLPTSSPAVGGAVASVGAGVAEAGVNRFFNWAYPTPDLPQGSIGPLNPTPLQQAPSNRDVAGAIVGGALSGPLGVAGAAASIAGAAAAASGRNSGRPKWVPRWAWPGDEPQQEEYPNQTDPKSMPSGPGTGAPTGGVGDPTPVSDTQAGISYRVELNYVGGEPCWYTGALPGPISVYWERGGFLYGDWQIFPRVAYGDGNSGGMFGGAGYSYRWENSQDNASNYRWKVIPLNPDGSYGSPVGSQGLNPARSRPGIGGAPGLLPPAPQISPDPNIPWPGVAPQVIPDTEPLAPAPEAPPQFTPTETPDQLPPTEPGQSPGPPDLEGPPKETPPNLGDDPDTPERTNDLGGKWTNNPDGSKTYEGSTGTRATYFPDGSVKISQPIGTGVTPINQGNQGREKQLIPPVLPIPIPVGGAQGINTPSAPNLLTPTENPNLSITSPPVQQTGGTNQPSKVCLYERARVMDIQTKATDTQSRAANPVSGFPGLYGLAIEQRTKIGQIFDFMKKAWETTRVQKVIDALTLITVLHNASFISRDVGETLGYALSQGLHVLGIDDEEGNPLDVNGWFGGQVNTFFENIFGDDAWHGLKESWNKANRILQAGSNILWTLRSIHDGTQEVLEWTAENTGKIGNALKKWGVVGEQAYPWMSEKVRAQDKWRRKMGKILDGLEQAEDTASSYGMVISEIAEVQDEIGELGEQRQRFTDSIRDMLPGQDPDNNAFLVDNTEAGENARSGPTVTPLDMEPSTDGTP